MFNRFTPTMKQFSPFIEILHNKSVYTVIRSMLLFRRIQEELFLSIFNYLVVDSISVIIYKNCMRDKNFFLQPQNEWQRRYEALRASFVDRLPAKVVADRFGYYRVSGSKAPDCPQNRAYGSVHGSSC